MPFPCQKQCLEQEKLSDKYLKTLSQFGGLPHVAGDAEHVHYHSFLKLSREDCDEVLPLSKCLWKKEINQQSKPTKENCNPMTSFQKAHHKPGKQFCIKFASNNRIKGILLVEKRLSILMFHELYINSA